VGGIYANNKFKANFIYENLSIQNNLIHGSYLAGIKNLIFLGSSCVYPRDCKQPIKEEYLLTGKLEKTNDAYAIAKIAGIKMCEAYNSQYKTEYKCLMPCNTYGPGDNYDKKNSHFMPALIKKIYQTREKKTSLELWGTGKAKREFIYVEDLADACIYFMNKKTKFFLINIGSGKDQTILKTARIALNTVKVKSKIVFDNRKIDGTPRKVLDVSLAKDLGWTSKTSLKDGILKTYNYYVNHQQ
jgi:GDP-L-fucose synthase